MNRPIASIAAALLFAAVCVTPSSAGRAEIDAAKAECIVGERNDGYLGIIDEGRANDALRRDVAAVNQQRKAAYANLAERNGVTIDAAATVVAERLINGAPSGHCVQDAAGDWIRVP